MREAEKRGGVEADCSGHGGDAAGVDQADGAPAVDEADCRTVRLDEINVEAAGGGEGRSQFAERERTGQAHEASETPERDHLRDRAHIAGNAAGH